MLPWTLISPGHPTNAPSSTGLLQTATNNPNLSLNGRSDPLPPSASIMGPPPNLQPCLPPPPHPPPHEDHHQLHHMVPHIDDIIPQESLDFSKLHLYQPLAEPTLCFTPATASNLDQCQMGPPPSQVMFYQNPMDPGAQGMPMAMAHHHEVLPSSKMDEFEEYSPQPRYISL